MQARFRAAGSPGPLISGDRLFRRSDGRLGGLVELAQIDQCRYQTEIAGTDEPTLRGCQVLG